MTLLVNVFKRGPNGEMEIVEPAERWQELAGFEDYRRKLYGSSAAHSLGLKLLLRLATGDIYVGGSEVDTLYAEATSALDNIELFEIEAGAKAEHLRSRFENIQIACRQAKAIGGSVVIW